MSYRNHINTVCILILLLTGQICQSQYLISGYIDSKEPSKKVYLSLLRYDELNVMNKNQILFSTTTDSLGYFEFKGNLLDEKDKLYRIHSNTNENSNGFDFTDLEDKKNFKNFIFSNTDTIFFEKSGQFWFSKFKNTNKVGIEWRAFEKVADELIKQLLNIEKSNIKNETINKILKDFKEYSIQNKVHPLPSLVMINRFGESTIKKDYANSSNFYTDLYDNLLRIYGESSYTLQYKDQLSKLRITSNEQDLLYHKRLNYVSILVILLLLFSNIYFILKIKKQKQLQKTDDAVNLTHQEQKVAELILEEKSNKEIASELFISLSTVKTHVRNIYSKLEVNNRTDFIEKMKNQPRD